ncbi:MAG: hypothetical protein ABH836_07180 [Candidatus Omnitrophota bacterium]
MTNKKKDHEKITYEIDPYNRLIINKSGKESSLPMFRQVLDGRFKIDGNNIATYQIKAPASGGTDMPHQVKLHGEWSLSKDHSLCLTLNKLGRETLGDKLTLRADIIDAAKNSIVFAVTTRAKENIQSTYILQLKGTWHADEHNRITFMVKREEGKNDILTFRGAWEINKQHEIIYQYEKTRLTRKEKEIHTLTLKGYWDIKDKLRVSYVLDQQSNSAIDFKTGLGFFKDNYIKYEVSIGGSLKPNSIKRAVTLSGKWKIKKGVGLTFEVKYENRRVHAIVFGAQAKLTAKDSISFELKNKQNEDIGAKLELSREILNGDGLSFLRFLKSKDETSVFVGAGFKW